MDALSSLGPDGFSVGFYQDNWEVVGVALVNAVKEVL